MGVFKRTEQRNAGGGWSAPILFCTYDVVNGDWSSTTQIWGQRWASAEVLSRLFLHICWGSGKHSSQLSTPCTPPSSALVPFALYAVRGFERGAHTVWVSNGTSRKTSCLLSKPGPSQDHHINVRHSAAR